VVGRLCHHGNRQELQRVVNRYRQFQAALPALTIVGILPKAAVLTTQQSELCLVFKTLTD
jgi:hypothetical protein